MSDTNVESEEIRVIRLLRDALVSAESHLSYCGYGDSWERECAGKLPEEIESALQKSAKYVPVEKAPDDDYTLDYEKEHVCSCGRVFKGRVSMKQHRKHSLKHIAERGFKPEPKLLPG